MNCRHCGLEVENRGEPSMDGNHEIKWVHVPGGYLACFPQQGAHSPLASPSPIAEAAEQCGWNPTDAAPSCDWDGNCPVHGAKQ